MATAHPASLLAPGVSERSITGDITSVPLHYPAPRAWWISFGFCALGVGLFIVSVGWLFWFGVGVWALQSPVFWGVAIASYVWWISMAHAGTLISALLLLISKGWRNSLNRFAEAMTVFAVVNAGLYPILHLGRPWLFYWLLPYPSTMDVWPQFKSPLEWDLFGVATYLIVSVLFWYIGLIPDLASVRDRAERRSAQVFYGVLALGWRNSAIHWRRWQVTYWIAGGLTVALVVMVESGVSLLFAVGIEPGWHTTIYPPFFLIGAIFEGFAVVLLISITLRHVFDLRHIVTDRHLDRLAQLLLLFGLMTLYCYVFDAFGAWYSGDAFERQILYDRWLGAYAFTYWGAFFCNFVPLQAVWLRSVRRKGALLVPIAALIAIGMWLEHFMEISSTLHRDFLPSSWQVYVPSFWEWSLLAGTVGLFLFFYVLFVRLLPMISMFELKEALHDDRLEREGA
ncbi:MAG: NrfD/PsrC family molybdoenzyme membrane anchor subunit [Geminicoccaceae bacterium]